MFGLAVGATSYYRWLPGPGNPGCDGKQPVSHAQIKPHRPEVNGLVERCNRTLHEALENHIMENRWEAEKIITKFNRWYNEGRCHRALGYVTPRDYHLGMGKIDPLRLDEVPAPALIPFDAGSGDIHPYPADAIPMSRPASMLAETLPRLKTPPMSRPAVIFPVIPFRLETLPMSVSAVT